MRLTTDQALERVAKSAYDSRELLRQDMRQRRHQVTDMTGIEYIRQGDASTPAVFYISISRNMVYMERFSFKLIVQPFATYSSGTDSATVDVNTTSLSVSGSDISPNPHDHTTKSHTHNLTSGITLTHTEADDFRIYIEGVEITEYLMAQYDWIDGEGVFPSKDIDKSYDILEVASDMTAEGRTEDADKLIHPGYKEVKITGNAPFQITMSLNLRYSHNNR